MGFNAEEEFYTIQNAVLSEAREELRKLKGNKEVKKGEYDFNNNIHEIVHNVVDGYAGSWGRRDCLALIDFCGNERWADDGIIDHSSIDRTLITTAYECVSMKLYDNEIIQDLQEYELSEEKRKELIDRIDEKLKDQKIEPPRETPHQKFFEGLKVDKGALWECLPQGAIDIGDGFKVFSKKAPKRDVNYNAIVIEGETHGKEFSLKRIYTMVPNAPLPEGLKEAVMKKDYKKVKQLLETW